MAKRKGLIRQDAFDTEDLTEKERFVLELCAQKRRQKYRLKWQKYLEKHLTYKEPLFINAATFTGISDSDDIAQYYSSAEAATRRVKFDIDATEVEIKAEAPKLPAYKKYPGAPKLMDESGWDVIYALPFFAKPGRHTYMVKCKSQAPRRELFVYNCLVKERRENIPICK